MFYDESYLPIEEKIEKCRKIMKENDEKISKLEFINKALLEETVRTIHNIITPLNEKMLDAAFCQQKKDDLEDRSMYKFVTKDVIERFFGRKSKAKLERIVRCGTNNYAYAFIFSIDDKKIEIKYPNVREINTENIVYADYGKYAIYYEEKPSIWNWICYSYDIEECAAKIAEFLEENKDE